ncbi:MAG: M48 family metalloprotease [Acidobacteria bacterium]|nr:M48 family metalloprotease [Acidobacteriota bacterium]
MNQTTRWLGYCVRHEIPNRLGYTVSVMKGRGTTVIISLVALLMALSPASGLAQQKNKKPLPTKRNPLMVGKRDINSHQINFYSLDREIALGQQLAAQVEMQLPLVNDPVITEYVNRIGQNLALHSDAKVPFTIKVVASDQVNAFALPGGFLYVNLGVLKVADTEAELAGVMAHEIAHVAARHALENVSKSELLSLGAIPLIFVGGPLGDLGRMGAELGLTAAFFKFSRGAEKEADELGAQYLWAAGYDPESLVSFFEKLASRDREVQVSSLFRSHPTTPDRIKNVRKLIAQFPERETYVVNTREFDSIKQTRLGGRDVRLGDLRRGDAGEPRPPVLQRRPSDEPSAGDDSRSTSSEPPAIQREDDRQPPKIVRRTSPDSPVEEQTSSTGDDGRQPPKIIRRTSPDSQTGEEPLPHEDVRPNQAPIVIRRTESNQQDTQPLPRTPPTLRRRY